MEPIFKSGRNLATATAVLLTVMTALMLAQAALFLLAPAPGSVDTTAQAMTFAFIGLIATCNFFVHTATIVLFSIWVYRATANLPALGSLSLRFTPGKAVWAFYIPFVNLVWSYQVMAMIWTESQPPVLNDAGFVKPRSLVIVNAWYALWLGGSVLGVILALALVATGAVAVAQAVSLLFNAAAAMLCAVMVYKADARQRAQAEDLARRASMPQPTGMELR